jgi:hypothetical protein
MFEVRAQDGGEQPRANDVVRLRTQVHREHAREQVGIVEPAARDLRRHRRGRPGVHDVGITGEAPRLVALVGGIALRRVGGRIDRET